MTRNILILYLFVAAFGCQNTRVEQKPKKPLAKEKPVPDNKLENKSHKKAAPSKQPDKDTINNVNTLAFLRAYGRKNLENTVEIETNFGKIRIRLYRDTPLHRASFIFLTKTGYFNTTNFHRVIKDFIVQGGNSDHPRTRMLRMKYKSYRIPAEIKVHRKHKYGALAAAREWDDNPEKLSSPFEFYIIQRKGGSHHLDGEHTIFGEVVSGMQVVDKIAQLKTDRKEWPVKDVYIKARVLK